MPKVNPKTSRKRTADDTSTDSEAAYDSETSATSASQKLSKSRAVSSKLKIKQKMKQFRSEEYPVDQWVQKLRESEDLNLDFVRILGEMQENIMDRLDILEENIFTFLEQKFCSTIIKDEDSKKLFFSEMIERHKDILKVELPISELTEFADFDVSLGDDKEKLDAFRNLITCMTAGSNHIDYDINTIMHATMTQNVRLHYSGAGRTYHGIRKKNFSITNIYHCMEDVLIDKYKKSPIELRIKNKISRWFSTRNYYY